MVLTLYCHVNQTGEGGGGGFLFEGEGEFSGGFFLIFSTLILHDSLSVHNKIAQSALPKEKNGRPSVCEQARKRRKGTYTAE